MRRGGSAIAYLLARGDSRLTGAIERLVQFYDATNKPDDAAKWKRFHVVERIPWKSLSSWNATHVGRAFDENALRHYLAN
jgi:hypothetical protein